MTVLALLGLVVGGLLLIPEAGRVTDASSVSPDALHNGVVSCGATGFLPDDDDTRYTIGSGHWRYWNGGGGSHFSCGVTLPNKAVVTKVQFTLADFDATVQVSACKLARHSLGVSTAADTQTLGSVPATGVSAQPGTIRLSDSSISNATVNNAGFWYTLECSLGFGAQVGIYAASDSYSTSP